MEPKAAIYKVLKHIEDDRKLNADEKRMTFHFFHVAGPGLLSVDQEKRILFKLESQSAIRLIFSDAFEDSNPDAEDYTNYFFRNQTHEVDVEVLPSFKKVLFLHQLQSGAVDWWKVTNIFWLMAQPIIRVYRGAIKLCTWVRNNRLLAAIITAVPVIIGLIVNDYSNAWPNLRFVVHVLGFSTSTK